MLLLLETVFRAIQSSQQFFSIQEPSPFLHVEKNLLIFCVCGVFYIYICIPIENLVILRGELASSYITRRVGIQLYYEESWHLVILRGELASGYITRRVGIQLYYEESCHLVILRGELSSSYITRRVSIQLYYEESWHLVILRGELASH